MKNYSKLSIIIVFVASLLLLKVPVRAADAELGEAYPQGGFDREWSGEWPDVGCAFTADKDEFSDGDKVVFSLSLSVPGEFDAAQCVPIYDVNVFEAETEGNVLSGGFAARGAAVLSQSYEEKSPAGDPVNSYNCVVCYEKPINGFSGELFTFTLIAKEGAAADFSRFPVSVFVKLINGSGDKVVFEAKPSVTIEKVAPSATTPTAVPLPEATAPASTEPPKTSAPTTAATKEPAGNGCRSTIENEILTAGLASLIVKAASKRRENYENFN